MKISEIIKKSPIGKHLDKKTLNKIDEIFTKSVAKGVESKMVEAVKLESAKFKSEMFDVIDMYIDKIVNEKLDNFTKESAKIKLAEKIIDGFKGTFGEMFMTEGNNVVAKKLESKINEYNEMIDKIKTDNEANLKMYREKFEKQITDLKSKIKVNESKVKVLNSKNMLEKAEKLIDENQELSKFGKSKAKKLVAEKISRIGNDKLTKEHIERIIESQMVRKDKNERLNKIKLFEKLSNGKQEPKPESDDIVSKSVESLNSM